MTDKERTVARGSVVTEHFVTIYNQDRWGVTLGDLRKLVAKAEGVDDSAEVHLEYIRDHYSIKDVGMAQRISIRHREKVDHSTVPPEGRDAP